jgi:ADP-ribose pyrophosphatase YjhB (NUDIX family)
VGGVVLIDGRVLLVKRRFEPLAGRWSLPGGALEVGESLAEGLARELKEETGLDVDVGPVVDVFDRITRDPDGRTRFHYVLIDYVCRPRGGDPVAGSDVSEVALADVDDLSRFDLTPKALEVIARALALTTGEQR